MAAMNLELGPPEVFLELPQTFAAKPPNSPPVNRVAILVAHGMGQQVPYETIDGVAQAVARGVGNGGGTVSKSVIRSVRMGTQGKEDAEPELVRAEMQIKESSGQEHEVHVYEAYWAPITEGKVSATDVVNFLFDAGWNGILNTTARTYRRWMFGAEQQFLLATEKLTFAFLGIMALLASLVFINSIAAAAAVSHAVGSSNPFPSGNLLTLLTWDFVLVDIAALLIAIGIFVFGRVNPRFIAWFFIYSGAALIVVAAIFMAGHLAQCPFLFHVVPDGGWQQFVSKYSLCIVALWTLEIWAASKARGFLIQYVGDVAAYIAAHTVSKFWEVRQQIWQTAMKVGEAVYLARTADDSAFLYTKIIVVGHSLGSVIGYDVLNGLLMDDQFSAKPVDVAARTRMFLTFGSPLDKTAFLFRTQKDMRSQVREVAAAAVQPMIADYRNRPQEWINLWSRADIISGHLDFYDPPNAINAKHPEHYVHARMNPKGIQNHIDPDAKTPLKAHIEYWDGKMFADQLYRGITT
ncbi:MAG: hypothetical protein ACHP8A_07830 [Terriglobales bacterium]